MDETKRREWQNPEAILDAVGLKLGFVFVDVGCGDGFFTLPAARLVGPKGKVYGIDVESQAIAEIRRKATGEGLTNLELIVGKAEETIPCYEYADIVFFGNVLHDFQNPREVIKNAKNMLKPKGKLANLDWKKIATTVGPPLSIRFDEATVVSLVESVGFKVITIQGSGKYHYLILANST